MPETAALITDERLRTEAARLVRFIRAHDNERASAEIEATFRRLLAKEKRP